MMHFVSHAHRKVVVPYRSDIAALLPHSDRITAHDGSDMLAVPHGNDETRLLRNMGLEVSAPIAEYYDWPGPQKPFSQQVATASHMTLNPRGFVLNDMGTGKTKSCLWAFDYLKRHRLARKMLVVAPLSTLRFVWQREAMLVPQMKVEVLDGPRERRLKRLNNRDADIYIVNHDGLKVIAEALKLRLDIDVFCFDEVGRLQERKR